MPAAARSLLAAVVATAALVGAGVALTAPDEEPERPAAATPASETLGDLDTRAVAARRTGFCDAVAAEDVEEAVGGEPAGATAYDNGDRAPLAGGTDVAHEFGCAWSGADGTTAGAWVFAPPVTEERARELRRLAVRTPGCRRIDGAPAYGVATIALECTGDDGRELSFRGLLGDAWLTCTLRAPAAPAAGTPSAGAPTLEERADRWCAAVLLAAEAT